MEQPRRLAAALGALTLSAAVAAHDAPPPRTVSVTGAGEIAARPDRARLSVGVEKLDPDLKKAEGEVNRVVRDYLKEAKALGAKDDQLSATGVNVSAEYVWPEGGRERKFTGYRVTRQIDVRVDNLDRLGDFILRATQAGVNQVNAPVLESSRAAELERQALARAADNARAKARQLTETLGVKLGVVARIVESGVAPPPMPFEMKAMRATAQDGSAEMGLALGEIRYRATVTAEFDLLPP